MTPALFMAFEFLVSLVAGFMGSLLGLGGGIIVVPALTLLLGIDIRYAIGASIISVIATSSGASVAYVRDHLTNLRVAMFLELATTLGAIGGALLAGRIPGRWLHLLFSGILFLTAIMMWRRPENGEPKDRSDSLADRLDLHSSFFDPSLGRNRPYRVHGAALGFVLSGVAGTVSGLLGIGGGILKVPTMNLGMGIPLKAASATSNLMIGVTAAASAGVYFARGEIDPFIAGPVAVGVLVGALFGASVLGKIRNRNLQIVFTLLLVFVAMEMLRKGLG